MTNTRQAYILYLFDSIKEHEHVFLKSTNPQEDIVAQSADFDILVRPDDMDALIEKLTSYKSILVVKIGRFTSMTQLFIYFNDHSFLQVDLLLKLVRKTLVYLDEEIVFEKKNCGVMDFT